MATSDAIRRAVGNLETALAEADTTARALSHASDEPPAWVDLFNIQVHRLSTAADALIVALHHG